MSRRQEKQAWEKAEWNQWRETWIQIAQKAGYTIIAFPEGQWQIAAKHLPPQRLEDDTALYLFLLDRQLVKTPLLSQKQMTS
jgi:hypothetical protein